MMKYDMPMLFEKKVPKYSWHDIHHMYNTFFCTSGITEPKAVVVTHSDYAERLHSVERIRARFPSVPILTRGGSISHIYKLEKAGALFDFFVIFWFLFLT